MRNIFKLISRPVRNAPIWKKPVSWTSLQASQHHKERRVVWRRKAMKTQAKGSVTPSRLGDVLDHPRTEELHPHEGDHVGEAAEQQRPTRLPDSHTVRAVRSRGLSRHTLPAVSLSRSAFLSAPLSLALSQAAMLCGLVKRQRAPPWPRSSVNLPLVLMVRRW